MGVWAYLIMPLFGFLTVFCLIQAFKLTKAKQGGLCLIALSFAILSAFFTLVGSGFYFGGIVP